MDHTPAVLREFEGAELSQTAATRALVGDVQVGNAFKLGTYGGRVLMDIYDELYPVTTR
jgi:hypothetical protein